MMDIFESNTGQKQPIGVDAEIPTGTKAGEVPLIEGAKNKTAEEIAGAIAQESGIPLPTQTAQPGVTTGASAGNSDILENIKGEVPQYEITWTKGINATQPEIPGTNIPRSFTVKGVEVNGKEVWVHANATKHMGEFVHFSKDSIIAENELMLGFQETLQIIVPKLKRGRNFFYVNGWEIGINGDTGVVYHALFK